MGNDQCSFRSNRVCRNNEFKSGEVLGNTALPQIVIVNSSTLKAVTEIPENYLGKIHKGMPVNIKLPDVNLEFNSSISLMNQTIGLNNRSVTTESKIPIILMYILTRLHKFV
jgi:hypothetical protein